MKLTDRGVGIYFMIFGILYALYMIFLIKMPHFFYLAIALGAFFYGLIKYLKSKKQYKIKKVKVKNKK